MATDKKISELPVATVPLSGTEKFEILQGGVNKQVDASDVGGGGSVTSVTGTSNRITSTGGATPVIDIDAAYDAAVTAEIAAAVALKSDSLLTYRTETASHELDATDLASVNAGESLNILMNVAGANNLTVPPNATQAFPVGSVVLIDQIGAGATTIVAGAGVTINSSDGLTLGGQYAGALIKKTATNVWYAQGKLKI